MKKKLFASLVIGGMTVALGTGISFKKSQIVDATFEDPSIINSVEITDQSGYHKRHPLVVPTDTYYFKQKTYSLSNVGDIESTWDYYKGDGVRIGIIDSGITYGHEDFPNLSNKSAYFYVSGNTVKTKLATSDNWQCMKHEYDSYYSEWDTHGSNVAGCAAAALNTVGTVGIAPNAEF